MRQLEDEHNSLRELLEEEEASKKTVEKQLMTVQAQVQHEPADNLTHTSGY